MKKLTSTLGIFALAIGAAAAMAMSPAPKKLSKTKAATMHWFTLNGTYLGQDTPENKQDQCGEPVVDCVAGYSSINDNQEPQGNPTILRGEQEL